MHHNMSMDHRLTRKQQEIYEVLLNHDVFTQAPTLEELCEVLLLKSRGSLHKHIQALIDAGLVEPVNRKQRGIRAIRKIVAQAKQLPMLGYIAAGKPIEAIENPGSVSIPEQLCGNLTCFVLQIKGDSMVEDGILDGDWVVIEQRPNANNGEIVVALIDGQEATLKHIEQRPGEIILHPANRNMKAISYSPNRVEIQGVLVGQMRSYRGASTGV